MSTTERLPEPHRLLPCRAAHSTPSALIGQSLVGDALRPFGAIRQPLQNLICARPVARTVADSRVAPFSVFCATRTAESRSTRTTSKSEIPLHRAHLDGQPHGRGCRRNAYEPEVLVERGRSFIERVDHNRSGRSESIRRERTAHSVPQQFSSHASPLHFPIHGETGHQNDGDYSRPTSRPSTAALLPEPSP